MPLIWGIFMRQLLFLVFVAEFVGLQAIAYELGYFNRITQQIEHRAEFEPVFAIGSDMVEIDMTMCRQAGG